MSDISQCCFRRYDSFSHRDFQVFRTLRTLKEWERKWNERETENVKKKSKRVCRRRLLGVAVKDRGKVVLILDICKLEKSI